MCTSVILFICVQGRTSGQRTRGKGHSVEVKVIRPTGSFLRIQLMKLIIYICRVYNNFITLTYIFFVKGKTAHHKLIHIKYQVF